MGLLDQNPFPFHHHDGKELHSILSTLFSPARAQSFCKRVKDFPLTLVDFASNADKVWEEVLDHGSSAGKLRDLAHVILDDREGARVRPLLERLLADPQEDPVVPATGGPLPDAATQAAPPTPVPGAFRMTVIRTLPGHAGWITCLAFSPDRRWLASADVHGTVLLWNLTDDNAAAVPLHGYQGTVYSVAFNNDSSRLATGGADHSIRLWDIGAPGAFTPGIAQKLPEPADSAPVLSVAFNDDGTLLASAEASGTVRLWQLMAPGTPNRVIWRHADQASRIVFSGSGKLLASAGADCSVRLWKAPFVGQPQVLNGHPGRVSGIAFSPDG